MFLFFIILNILSGNVCPMKHPMHISSTNIEYVQNQKTIEVAFKLFTSDIEEVIKKNYTINLNLGKKDESKEAQLYINRYIDEHFSIEINNNSLKMTNFELKEKKQNEESTWFFFKIKFDSKIKKIKVKSSMICDLFQDQINLLIINVNGEQKGFNLNYKETEAVFEL